MSELRQEPQSPDRIDSQDTPAAQPSAKPLWETPKMEDVSEQVMAQPYIRFT